MSYQLYASNPNWLMGKYPSLAAAEQRMQTAVKLGYKTAYRITTPQGDLQYDSRGCSLAAKKPKSLWD